MGKGIRELFRPGSQATLLPQARPRHQKRPAHTHSFLVNLPYKRSSSSQAHPRHQKRPAILHSAPHERSICNEAQAASRTLLRLARRHQRRLLF